jgi:hypothetical protein
VHQDGKISRCASHHRQEGTEVGCERINRQEYQTHEVATRQGRLGRYSVAHVLFGQIHAYLLRNAHGRGRCLETVGHRQNRSKSVPESAGSW